MKNRLVVGLLLFFLIYSGGAVVAAMLTTKAASISEVASYGMPRGRGDGRGAMKAFWWGFFAIIPFLAFLAAPFAYYHGIRNVGRIRKLKGAAMVGILLATFGLLFTIAILTA